MTFGGENQQATRNLLALQYIHTEVNFRDDVSVQNQTNLQMQEAAFCVLASMEQLRLLLGSEARLLPRAFLRHDQQRQIITAAYMTFVCTNKLWLLELTRAAQYLGGVLSRALHASHIYSERCLQSKKGACHDVKTSFLLQEQGRLVCNSFTLYAAMRYNRRGVWPTVGQGDTATVAWW